jgi:uncharacterized membrane protein
MPVGPVQLLVLGFDHPDFHGQIKAELDRLHDNDSIRIIDLLAVRKDADGNVERLRASDLSESEAEELGAVAGALIGLGAAGEEGAAAGALMGADALRDGEVLPDDVWYVDDAIPDDSAAAVVLIEHLWAIPLRDAIRDAGGFHLADAWIHPLDLVAVGVLAREEADQHLLEQP